MPTDTETEVTITDAGSAEASLSENAALVAAAEAAMAAEGADNESTASATPVTDKGAEAADNALAAKTLAPTSTEPTLAQRLRRRENEQRIKDEARRINAESQSSLDRERQQLANEKASLEAERRSVAETQARYKAAASDPVKMGELAGLTREQLAHELTMAGSPEHAALMDLRAKAAALEEKHRAVDEFIASQKKRDEDSVQSAKAAEYQQKLEVFIQAATNQEKFPALNALYEPYEILEKGKAVQKEYHRRTGNLATDEEIAEYLELHEARPRLDKIRQGSAGSAIATKPKANGPRTLSASSASERRATPKRIDQLTPAEEYQRLIEIADEAMRTATS